MITHRFAALTIVVATALLVSFASGCAEPQCGTLSVCVDGSQGTDSANDTAANDSAASDATVDAPADGG